LNHLVRNVLLVPRFLIIVPISSKYAKRLPLEVAPPRPMSLQTKEPDNDHL
jgi:hypothetical protein